MAAAAVITEFATRGGRETSARLRGMERILETAARNARTRARTAQRDRNRDLADEERALAESLGRRRDAVREQRRVVEDAANRTKMKWLATYAAIAAAATAVASVAYKAFNLLRGELLKGNKEQEAYIRNFELLKLSLQDARVPESLISLKEPQEENIKLLEGLKATRGELQRIQAEVTNIAGAAAGQRAIQIAADMRIARPDLTAAEISKAIQDELSSLPPMRRMVGLEDFGDRFRGQVQKVNREIQKLNQNVGDLVEASREMTFDTALAQMEDLFRSTLASRAEILRIQSAIGRTSLNEEVFLRATQATLDLRAARPEMSAEATSQWVTTLLGDPSRTMEKFRRAEIQVSLGYQQAMERLVSLGRLEEAQRLTIDQLTQRFGGAAQRVADTDIGQMQQAVKEWKDITREASSYFQKEFAPVFREFSEYLRENREELLNLFKDMAKHAAEIARALSSAIQIAQKLLSVRESLIKTTRDADASMGERFLSGAVFDLARGSVVNEGALDLINGIREFYISRGPTPARPRRLEGSQALLFQREVQQRRIQAAGLTDLAVLQERNTQNLIKMAKERKKVEEENYAAFLKFGKRVGVLIQDQEEPLERLQRQIALVNTWLREGQQYAGQEQRVMQGREIISRLTADYRAQMEKEREARESKLAAETRKLSSLFEKYIRQDPVKALAMDFQKMLATRGAVPLPTALAGFRGMQEKVAELQGQKVSKAFQPVTTGIEGLYNSIRDRVLTRRDDPIEKQTRAQKRMLEDLSSKLSKEIQTLVRLGTMTP